MASSSLNNYEEKTPTKTLQEVVTALSQKETMEKASTHIKIVFPRVDDAFLNSPFECIAFEEWVDSMKGCPNISDDDAQQMQMILEQIKEAHKAREAQSKAYVEARQAVSECNCNWDCNCW